MNTRNGLKLVIDGNVKPYDGGTELADAAHNMASNQQFLDLQLKLFAKLRETFASVAGAIEIVAISFTLSKGIRCFTLEVHCKIVLSDPWGKEQTVEKKFERLSTKIGEDQDRYIVRWMQNIARLTSERWSELVTAYSEDFAAQIKSARRIRTILRATTSC